MLAAVAALLGVLTGILVGAQLLVAGARLDSAADLAALAGAAAAAGPAGVDRSAPDQQTPGDPCSRAGSAAERNGARLDDCTLEGATVTVVVSTAAPPGLARLAAALGVDPPRLHSRARAGPSRG